MQTLTSFDLSIHVKPSNVYKSTDRTGLETMAFHLPRTKMVVHGEIVMWAAQSGVSDLRKTLETHLRVNSLPSDDLFAYHNKKEKYTALTKKKFLEVLIKATKAANLELLQGHGI